jgi:hypothetical protein
MILDIKNIKTQYITLDFESERSKRLSSQLSNYGFTNFEPILGVPDQLKRMGVAKAFLNAMQKNSKHNEPFLLLEDDAFVWHDYDKVEVPDDADAVYLGVCYLGGPSTLNSYYTNKITDRAIVKKINEDVYRVYAMLNAHAIIIINPEYRDFLIKVINTAIDVGTNQDRARAETMKYWNVYAMNKPMFYQEDEFGQKIQTEIILSDAISNGDIFTDISML